MDRIINYAGALVPIEDTLATDQNAMIALGMLTGAAFGNGTFVDGLAAAPTSPATMSINIGQGLIIAQETVDPNAYGTLGVNNANLMKMGINVNSTTLSLAGLAPSTPGQSVNVLIEASFLEQDGSPLILPYYNSSNPAAPLSGAGGSGTAQNTRRTQTVNLAIKSGAAAASGSQNTPSADAGSAALWVVTLVYGQLTINAGAIQIAPNAPFIGTKLGQLRRKLMANLTLYVSTTGNDTYNNGLSTSSAFLTIQAAWNALINNYDLNGYSATISVGAGSFASVNCAGTPVGLGASSVVLITGAGASTIITSTGIGGCINAQTGAFVTVSSLTCNGVYGLQAFAGSQITNGGGIIFGACSGVQQNANGGLIFIAGNSTVTGSAQAFMATVNGGNIQVFGTPSVTLTGTPAFSVGFASTSTGGISAIGMTFSGSATGPRFSALLGGAINTGTGNTSFFPGSTAGTTGSGTNTGFYA